MCHAHDLISVQIDGFDGYMVFFANVKYIVGVLRRFLNIGRQKMQMH
jgi:hypothetical protein